MDYDTGTYTVVNKVIGSTTEYRITDRVFRLPGDNIITVSDEFISKIREELKCGK
jgi:hypothetical protein